MSATSSARSTTRRTRPRKALVTDPRALTLIEFSVATGIVVVLTWALYMHWSHVVAALPVVLPWLVLAGLADLLPVPIWGSVQLMMSFPVLLAAAFVFPAYLAGAISFLGVVDAREVRREIPLGRALFNRSNVAISVMAAAWVFDRLGGDVLQWPAVMPAALLAFLVDLLINATLVILGTRLLTGLSPAALVRNVYGGSEPLPFVAGYACFGLLALVLATLYQTAGTWGLLAFAIPVLLARQMFVQLRRVTDAHQELSVKDRLLRHVTSRIADERRDERLVVAAGIHDDVLPPLYKVHLMGQVLRQDLASGRLLDLEADVPNLLEATEAASRALRDLISDLRSSTLGPGGLVQTLELFTQSLTAEYGIRIALRAEPVPGTPLTHLLVYQVAREAMMNVVRHSGADSAEIILGYSGDSIRLIIQDNGRGFQPMLVDGSSHFGLQLMRERVELAGGVFLVEASPRTGTRVVARVPVERAQFG